MAKQALIVCLAVLTLSTACARSVRKTSSSAAGAAEPGQTVSTEAQPPRPYRPLHKGGADISTGIYTREDDDLFLNTTLPIVLRRTYESGDHHSRYFGVSATHPGEWWLYGDGDPRIPWGDLILADGARIHFTRISPGDTQEGAVLRHDSTPTEFNGALLSWNGSRWEMKFRDGAVAFFLDCQGEHDRCALVERRDPQGHRIAYVRDQKGMLLRMESEGQSIGFDYDDRKRIIRAYDTSQNAVSYTYDERGYLVRAMSSDGTIRNYGYDDRDYLTEVREPGRVLKNWYDEAGRWIRQEVRISDDDDDPYIATVHYIVEDGSIVQTDFDEGDGVERVRYNRNHYPVSETFDAEGPAPITFTYDRNEKTNVVNGATISCTGPSGPITRPAPVTVERDDSAKAAMTLETCLLQR